MNRYRKYRSYGHGRFVSLLAAPHIGVVLACAAAAGLIVGLSGCNASTQAGARNAAQGNLNDLVPACRDGVQYLVTPYYGPSTVIVPRLKPDGSLYRCKIQREPTRVVEEWEGL